jgi:mycobactin phenyloxazoline synthetase
MTLTTDTTAGAATQGGGADVSAEAIRAQVAEALGIDASEIDDDVDLVSLGLDSLRLMTLTNAWRKAGIKVHFSTLVLDPTVSAISQVLETAPRRQPKAPPPEPATAPSASATPDTSDEFGLATMQHAYWVGRDGGQSLGGVAAHLYAEFDGYGIDADRFGAAVCDLVHRHPMLRAAITDDGTQVIKPDAPQAFTLVDLRNADADEADVRLAELRDSKSHQLMEVAAGQVIDVTLTLLPEGRHRVHVDVDMLAADALSYRRLLDDLAALYRGEALPGIDYTFREYLAQHTIDEATHAADRAWWQDKIADLPEPATLPTIAETERAEPNRSIRLARAFDADAKQALIAAGRSRGITTAVALAAVFSDVVARWSTQQRFLLNVPLFDRQQLHPDVDGVVGDFTNSLLIDADMRADEPLAARARRLQSELHTSGTHSGYTGLDVLRDLGRARGGAVTASVVFTSGLDLGEVFSPRVTELLGSPVWIISQGPQVDLDAQIVEYDGGFLVNWDLRRDALPDGVAEVMFERFCETLDELSARPDCWDELVGADIPQAQRQVRERTNDTGTPGPARTLHGNFFATAAAEPDRVALLSGDPNALESITYGQLAGRALEVAGNLIAAGVRPGDTVGILLPKGPEQIVAVLAVHAAGAHYLPINVEQPSARRRRILQRGGVAVVLTDTARDLNDDVRQVFVSGTDAAPIAAPVPVDANDLAYVLFTSGSTGEPKGVELTHAAAAATIDAIAGEFGIGADDRTIGLSALDFDLSVYDIFAPLSVGGAVVAVAEADKRDAQVWSELIHNGGVTVVNAAPGLIGMIADTATPQQLSGVRIVITGGDRVPAALAHRLRSAVPGLRFAGLGGTTETAIHSTICEVTDDFPESEAAVGYGIPLRGVQCRVVNASGQDCPDWVVGELWIGGTGVARGYRGDAERTADRFVTHGGVRWYRTGDLARYRPDGTLDFFGRSDHQVKVRGHRIELGEVEAALIGLAPVTEAVAFLAPNGQLAAAVCGDVTGDGLVSALGEVLPPYMIPSTITVLETMPLTGNGKLDRAAIGRAVELSDPAAYVAPETTVEAAIEYVMAQVIGAKRFGVETDFFDAGGDSILATGLTARLRGLLALPRFRVSDVFSHRTARGIAEHLAAAEDAARVEQVAQILLEVAGVPSPSAAAR